MKIELNNAEIGMLIDSVSASIKSAKRGQNSGKSPQLTAVYAEVEKHLTSLETKLRTHKQ